MTHNSAVATIVKLLPDIEKRGAEVVLAEHATKEDLPVAQLEKLAQVFNTLRTLDHIDHSEDRGSSVPLVDTTSLVINYARGYEGEKAASAPTSFSSHDTGSVDLMSAIRKAAIEPVMAKAAAEAPPAPEPQSYNERLDGLIRHDHAALCDAAFDLAMDARIEMSKFAASIVKQAARNEDGAVLLAVAEEDAMHIRNIDCVKAACDWLATYVEAGRSTLVRREDKQLVKRAFVVTSPLSNTLCDLVDAYTTYTTMEKLAMMSPPRGPGDTSVFRASVNPEGTPSPGSSVKAEELNQQFMERYNSMPDGPEKDAFREAGIANGVPGLEEPEGATAAETLAAASKAGLVSTNPSAGGGTLGDTEEEEGSSGGGKGGKGKGGKSPSPALASSTGSGVGSFLSGAWGAAKAPFSASADMLNATADKANSLLTQITSKERNNSAQQRTDVSVADIKRAIEVRRLIANDPVLSQADLR